MILSDIREEILRGLKEPSTGGSWSAGEILRRINLGQKKIVRLTGCMSAIYTATTVVGQSSYTKPTTCLRVNRVYYSDSTSRLFPTTIGELDLLSKEGKISRPWSGNSGTPTHYYQNLQNIYLYPKPDAAETLGMECLLRPDDLAADADIPFNEAPYMGDYHDTIVSFVLWKCLLEDQNDIYIQHKKEFEEGIGSILRDLKPAGESLDTFRLIGRGSTATKGPLPGLQFP